MTASQANRGQWLLWAGALLLAACLPLVVSDYRVLQATMTLIFAILLLGLNILTGYSGQISLGHGAFYAIGAYTAAILMQRMGLPYYLTIPLAAGLCWVAGFLFGLPALRLEGHYLALATFALAVATPQLLKYKKLQPFTGGVGGILIDKPQVPFGLPVSIDTWLYWFTLAVAALVFLAGRNLLKGRMRRALLALRDQPAAAAAMGVDLAKFKTLAFAVSAMFAGIAGALSAIVVQFVSPDSFTPMLSIMFLVGIVVGGTHSMWGPLLGAMFLQFVPNITDDLSKSASWALYGVAMVLCVFLMPRGIAGALASLAQFAKRRLPPHPDPLVPAAKETHHV